jgi:hypothetical protein
MAFAASTPIGAVLAYEFFSFFGPESRSSWSGIALLASVRLFLNFLPARSLTYGI